MTLVGQGYEAAFEEIVRRYRKPLGRYAEAIVGGRSEDVTQEAFSKALQALRRSDGEIDLRPWLYRIVRNTALNDLRDRPAAAEELADAIAGGRTPTEIVEGRERLTDLIRRLRSLPEAQRAAIVMRELEGLGHDEIGSALGLSGGAARQAIYRARQALRDGLGVLVPLPLTRSLLEDIGAGSAETTAGVANAGGAAGAGVALKAAAATIMVAGAVGAGIAIERPPGDGELRSTVGVDRAIAGGPDGIAPKEGAAPRKDSGDGNAAGGRRGPGDMRGDGSRGRSRGRGPRGADHRHGPGGGSARRVRVPKGAVSSENQRPLEKAAPDG